MNKFKLVFLVLFLIVFQLSFSFSQNAKMMAFSMDNGIENQLLIENSYITQNITLEHSKNQFDVLANLHSSKYFLSTNNAEGFHLFIVQGNLLFNSVKAGHLLDFCLSKKVINVPIYLQTESFRL